MKDIIHVFKYDTRHQSIYSHFFKNIELQFKKKSTTRSIEKSDHLFNNNGISSEFEFNEARHKLLKACLKENVKLFYLLTRKKIECNVFFYVLNENEGTVGVLGNQTEPSEAMIPRSIQDELKNSL